MRRTRWSQPETCQRTGSVDVDPLLVFFADKDAVVMFFTLRSTRSTRTWQINDSSFFVPTCSDHFHQRQALKSSKMKGNALQISFEVHQQLGSRVHNAAQELVLLPFRSGEVCSAHSDFLKLSQRGSRGHLLGISFVLLPVSDFA